MLPSPRECSANAGIAAGPRTVVNASRRAVVFLGASVFNFSIILCPPVSRVPVFSGKRPPGCGMRTGFRIRVRSATISAACFTCVAQTLKERENTPHAWVFDRAQVQTIGKERYKFWNGFEKRAIPGRKEIKKQTQNAQLAACEIGRTSPYCGCSTSSITTLPPFSVATTVCRGAYPLRVMSIT